MEGRQWCLLGWVHQLLANTLQWTMQPPVLVEHHIKPQNRATQQKTLLLITNMTTITTGAPTECFLTVLSTRAGQQDEQSAKDRCWIGDLLQQHSDTTTQLAHISNVLDCLLTGHSPIATLADTPAAPSTSAGNGPFGPASSLLQQGTATSEIHSTASSFQVSGQAAPHSHAEVQQDQAGTA